jgi:hypothetical protein
VTSNINGIDKRVADLIDREYLKDPHLGLLKVVCLFPTYSSPTAVWLAQKSSVLPYQQAAPLSSSQSPSVRTLVLVPSPFVYRSGGYRRKGDLVSSILA